MGGIVILVLLLLLVLILVRNIRIVQQAKATERGIDKLSIPLILVSGLVSLSSEPRKSTIVLMLFSIKTF